MCQSRQTQLLPLEHDLVVDCVESRRQVEASQNSDLLVVGSRVVTI